MKYIRVIIAAWITASAAFAGTTYQVDPDKGEDMGKVNALTLGPGDKVVIAPGVHHETLMPNAAGTKENPVVIQFAPGRHEFRADHATRKWYFVSNSTDASPDWPYTIGILVQNCRHLQIVGGKGCDIWYGDRMTELINDQSEDITYSGLSFDFVRPMVSEFRVLETGANTAVIQPAEGSTCKVENGSFSWTGKIGAGGWSVLDADLDLGLQRHIGSFDPFKNATATDLGGGKIQLTYANGTDTLKTLKKGHQIQMRKTNRDNVSVANMRCKDLVFRGCNFYSLPGMGLVSQFTENITLDHVSVTPRPGSDRVCPAWADCFHFAGCRGEILVDSCLFNGSMDDAINVHGLHLQLKQKIAADQVLVRFAHSQTYGFAAFQPGDKVEFVNHETLIGYAANTVTAVARKSDKEWVLTMGEPVADFGKDDVVDNLTWYPNFTARNCTVKMDSCRGFLITTRGKAVVEDCTFLRTTWDSVLVEDDASSWFESGPIRDLTIRRNHFIDCNGHGPAITIHPENGKKDLTQPVHENVHIENNNFEGSGAISAKSTKGLWVTGNRFTIKPPFVQTTACVDVDISNNETAVAK